MNKSLVLLMCDVLVLSAMSLSSGGFDWGNEGAAGGRGESISREDYESLTNLVVKFSNDWVKVTGALSNTTDRAATLEENVRQIEVLLANATNELVLVTRDVLTKSNALNMAKVELSALSNKNIQVAGALSNAINQVARAAKDARDSESRQKETLARLEAVQGQLQAVGGFVNFNASVVNECLCHLYVQVKEDDMQFMSPLISIGTNRYVMAYMDHRDDWNFDKVQVRLNDENVSLIGRVKTVWRLPHPECPKDKNIVLFKVDMNSGVKKIKSLNLGASESNEPDAYYWVASKVGDVKSGLLGADVIEAINKSRELAQGDMLISVRHQAVVRMVIGKTIMDGEIKFGKIEEQNLEVLRSLP